MGGSSSSSSSSATNAFDKRLAVSSGVGVTGDSNIISVTSNSIDAGAVGAGRDVALYGLKVSGDSIKEAIDGVVRGQEQALAGQLAATRDAIASTNAAVTSATRDALASNSSVTRDAMSLADRSQGLVAKSASEALGYTGHVVDLALSDSRAATDAVQQAVNQVARAYDTATNYQAEKSTTDNRYLMTAGMVVIGLVALRAFK